MNIENKVIFLSCIFYCYAGDNFIKPQNIMEIGM